MQIAKENEGAYTSITLHNTHKKVKTLHLMSWYTLSVWAITVLCISNVTGFKLSQFCIHHKSLKREQSKPNQKTKWKQSNSLYQIMTYVLGKKGQLDPTSDQFCSNKIPFATELRDTQHHKDRKIGKKSLQWWLYKKKEWMSQIDKQFVIQGEGMRHTFGKSIP
jgi:hypothetical protein